MNNVNLKQQDALEFLIGVPDKSVDLVLTDPPYVTSRETGMNKWAKHVVKQDADGSIDARTQENWMLYRRKINWSNWFAEKSEVMSRLRIYKNLKQNYIKYGSIYGKKYAVKTDYGSWDSEFTLEMLEECIKHFYRVLKDGGTCIIFFDIWKVSQLKDMLESAGPEPKKKPIPRKRKKDETEEKFERRRQNVLDNPYNNQIGFKQLRFIEWIKTNPQPLNSSRNYLTNCREIALLGIKKGSGTFNSKYDNGIYEYPIQCGKDRFHPTQKSLPLFEELIEKHSNEGDVVLDCFAGSGTTAVAAINTSRGFIGCELDQGYYDKSSARLKKIIKEIEG